MLLLRLCMCMHLLRLLLLLLRRRRQWLLLLRLLRRLLLLGLRLRLRMLGNLGGLLHKRVRWHAKALREQQVSGMNREPADTHFTAGCLLVCLKQWSRCWGVAHKLVGMVARISWQHL